MTAAKKSNSKAVADDQKSAPAEIEHLVQLATDDLSPASWNARKTLDPSAMEGLTASIRERGIQVPLIVRHAWRSVWVDFEDGISDSMQFAPMAECSELLLRPGAKRTEVQDHYEIVAGHRRYEAAKRLGLDSVPAIVRTMTEDQAREIGLVDNLQRENVPAMEEAVAFAELRDRLLSIEAVAARVQKDQAYVAQRLKLCSLSLAGQDSLRHALITVEHAMVLARLGAAEQDLALKWCLDRNAGVKTSVDAVIDNLVRSREEDGKEKPDRESYRWRHTWEPQSVQQLKDHVASESGIVLSRAPWDLDVDVLIPDAVACNACPQNTKANAPLFGDLEIGEPKCTDTGCFKEKTQAFVQLQVQAAKVDAANGTGANALAPIVRVSWKSTSVAPRMEIDKVTPVAGTGINKVESKPNLAQVFKHGQWDEAKKKCEHACPAVTVDWSDANARGYMDSGDGDKLRRPGEIIRVCIEPKCKAHPKDYARPKSVGSRNSPRDEKAEAEARERANAERIAESKIRVEVASRAIAQLKSLPGEVIRELALRALPNWEEALKPYRAVMPDVRKSLLGAKTDSIEFAKAVALASIKENELTVRGGWSAKETRGKFIQALKRIGYDASKSFDKPKAEKPSEAKKAAKTAAKKTAKKGGRK